jgi:LPS-assembly protein
MIVRPPSLISSLIAAAICIVLVLTALLISWPARAATSSLRIPGGGQVIVNAKNAFRDYDKGTLELSGDVQILYGAQYISCDHAIVSEKTHEVVAEGNLVISSPQAYLEGDRAILNYVLNTGTIMNGVVKSGQILLEGKILRKTGVDTYVALDASFTACTTCPTAWTFGGSEIDAQMGGYASIKSSVLRVGGFPVFWTPYLIVPLKSERQTGLLIPSLEFGVGGVALDLKYFWAISRSQDLTFTAKDYTARGPKGLFDYRYVFSKTSQGELNTGYVNDVYFARDQANQGIQVGPNINRWYINYNHHYEMPYGFSQNTSLNYVSDLRYPRDFPEDILGQADPALENRASLTRNTEKTHASMDIDYYLDQLKTNPVASNSDAVHRWPELRYEITETPILGTGILFNLHTDYVNFAREDYAYDKVVIGPVTVNPDGTTSPNNSIDPTRLINPPAFNPAIDQIRTGQRLDLAPSLSYPFHIGPLDILTSGEFRHTQYSFDVSTPPNVPFESSPWRDYALGSVSARMRFFKIYQGSAPEAQLAPEKIKAPPSGWTDRESEGTTVAALAPPPHPDVYRHEIEPEISYTRLPYFNQTSNTTFFGTAEQLPAFLDNQPVSTLDFESARGIQFDYYDRLSDRNAITFALNNHLIQKKWMGSQAPPVYKRIVNLQLAQSFDFDEAKKTNTAKFPWSDISVLLDVRLDHFETNTIVHYFPYHRVANTQSRVRLMDPKLKRFVEASFDQTFQSITQDISVAGSQRTQTIALGAGFDSKLLTFTGAIGYNPAGFFQTLSSPMANWQLLSWSTLLNFKPPGNCWGIRLTLDQSFGGLASYHIDFDYKFGGETPPPTQPPNI